MAEQHLDLLDISAGLAAKLGAGAAQVEPRITGRKRPLDEEA